VTAAFISDELLAAAKARGAIPQLTWDFSATRDSDNAPWTDSLTMSVPAGTSLLDLWRQFVGMGYESEMTPDLRLRFWKDRSLDFSQTVIFRHDDGRSPSVGLLTAQARARRTISGLRSMPVSRTSAGYSARLRPVPPNLEDVTARPRADPLPSIAEHQLLEEADRAVIRRRGSIPVSADPLRVSSACHCYLHAAGELRVRRVGRQAYGGICTVIGPFRSA